MLEKNDILAVISDRCPCQFSVNVDSWISKTVGRRDRWYDLANQI
jgi:hypothetical protein